ncbi:hypothetical protein BDZ94DRAFT_1285903 [Collybia nuda]|uniref:Uncharacterized protein n=1 Tax=Collybia nuda TaxID=64659 RepID=A0A9P6CCG8_9AGAR|nr:hypothetical protein BDZ94DRAFT_1285903 [Collybia nuda]
MAQTSIPTPSSMLSTTLQTVVNYFKPHRAEALQRIRLNGFCFIIVVVFTNLLPLPSIQAAIRTVVAANEQERWASDWLYKWFCIFVAVATVFAFNFVEGIYAVKYPRPPLAPYASPAKTKPIFRGDPTPQRPFRVLSPNSSPQPQRPFSLSASTSKYPTSPMSTPSRVLQYSTLPASTNTQASSTSTMAFHSTPSPIISAYRGKNLGGSVGHAVDGSFLSRIAPEASDEEN